MLVQAGVWLNLLTLRTDGLSHQVTRRLARPPAAIAPADLGLIAHVMTRIQSAQPEIREVMLATPSTEPFENNLEQFLPAIEARLGLTLNDWGDPQRLQ